MAHRTVFGSPSGEISGKLKELEELAKSQPGEKALNVRFDLSPYKLRFRGKDHRLSSMEVVVHVVDTAVQLNCAAYELVDAGGQKRLLHHAAGVFGENQIQLLMPEGLHSRKIALRIGKAPLTPKQKANERKAKRKKGARKRGD
jgi:hypothetical protein